MSRIPLPLAPRALRYGAVALVAGYILYASLLDPPATGPVRYGPFGVLGIDKWLHALAYGGLATVVGYALAPRTVPGVRRSRREVLRWLAVCVALAVGFGLAVEVAQYGLPERTFDLADLAANATGALVTTSAWYLVSRFVHVRRVGPAASTD